MSQFFRVGQICHIYGYKADDLENGPHTSMPAVVISESFVNKDAELVCYIAFLGKPGLCEYPLEHIHHDPVAEKT